MDEHGVYRTLWSGMTWQYWLATRNLDPSEFDFLRGGRDTKALDVGVPAGA